MAGTYTYLGSLTLGGCVPLAALAQAELSASLAIQLPALEAQIAGILAVQASLTVSLPSLEASVAAAASLLASLQGPTVSIDLAAVAAVLAELQASLGALQASLAASAAIAVTLGTPGVYAWSYQGTAGTLVPGGLPDSGTETPVSGFVFAASDGGAQTALEACFGGE